MHRGFRYKPPLHAGSTSIASLVPRSPSHPKRKRGSRKTGTLQAGVLRQDSGGANQTEHESYDIDVT